MIIDKSQKENIFYFWVLYSYKNFFISESGIEPSLTDYEAAVQTFTLNRFSHNKKIYITNKKYIFYLGIFG